MESGDEWEVKGAEDPARGVVETGRGWDQEAAGQDRDPDPVYDSLAS